MEKELVAQLNGERKAYTTFCLEHREAAFQAYFAPVISCYLHTNHIPTKVCWQNPTSQHNQDRRVWHNWSCFNSALHEMIPMAQTPLAFVLQSVSLIAHLFTNQQQAEAQTQVGNLFTIMTTYENLASYHLSHCINTHIECHHLSVIVIQQGMVESPGSRFWVFLHRVCGCMWISRYSRL